MHEVKRRKLAKVMSARIGFALSVNSVLPERPIPSITKGLRVDNSGTASAIAIEVFTDEVLAVTVGVEPHEPVAERHRPAGHGLRNEQGLRLKDANIGRTFHKLGRAIVPGGSEVVAASFHETKANR